MEPGPRARGQSSAYSSEPICPCCMRGPELAALKQRAHQPDLAVFWLAGGHCADAAAPVKVSKRMVAYTTVQMKVLY